MELIFQPLFFRPYADEFFNSVELLGVACLESAGVMEDKTVSRRIDDSLVDVMLSTLRNVQCPQRIMNR